MIAYFLDNNNRYIGNRELAADETLPENAVSVEPILTDKQEAHFLNGSWLITDIVEPTPVHLSDEEKKARYEELSVQYIREQYSVDDEAQAIREYLANATNAAANFTAYNTYVESCKAKAHLEAYGV